MAAEVTTLFFQTSYYVSMYINGVTIYFFLSRDGIKWLELNGNLNNAEGFPCGSYVDTLSQNVEKTKGCCVRGLWAYLSYVITHSEAQPLTYYIT